MQANVHSPEVGFTTDAQVRNLFIWDPQVCESATDVPENVRFIPVNTLLVPWIVD